MSIPKNQITTKSKLHPRSRYKTRYNFKELIVSTPELKHYVFKNKYGDLSIDFFDPKAVKILNRALLKYNHNIEFWDIPKGYLCPPIPGRLDYIHYMADLMECTSKNPNIIGLDIGTGANCIYPLLGHNEYGWNFIASDIDKSAIDSAKNIMSKNKLNASIEIRLQENKANKLKGILKPNELIAFVICNPPFHSSEEEAKKASIRKLKNLKNNNSKAVTLNFSGQHNELWCKGGESRFIKDLIFESRHFSKQCQWFTTLVSKASNLKGIYSNLKKVNANKVKTIEMGQGQKISRIVAWSFQ